MKKKPKVTYRAGSIPFNNSRMNIKWVRLTTVTGKSESIERFIEI
jgi:hypothetical protein